MTDKDKEEFINCLSYLKIQEHDSYYSTIFGRIWQAACEYKDKQLLEAREIIEFYASPDSYKIHCDQEYSKYSFDIKAKQYLERNPLTQKGKRSD